MDGLVREMLSAHHDSGGGGCLQDPGSMESKEKREGREPESYSLRPQLPTDMEMRRVLSSQDSGIKKMEISLKSSVSPLAGGLEGCRRAVPWRTRVQSRAATLAAS